MRLRVQPWSLWLAYGVTQPRRLQAMLPKELALARVRLTECDVDEGPRLLFNAYHVDSAWMTGHRVEVQTLAVHRTLGTPHLVVLDAVSDVLSWDPERGLQPPTLARVRRDGLYAPPGPGRRRPRYALRLRDRNTSEVQLHVRGELSRECLPTRRFVVDANRACYFGATSVAYPMAFDDDEIARPVRMLDDRRLVVRNKLWRSMREPSVSHAFVHPHAMHFRVQVPGMWYDVW